ncbi:MAG: ABC transporter transmembrane domain-containing protein [Candidatus Helarchaeota archaeon]
MSNKKSKRDQEQQLDIKPPSIGGRSRMMHSFMQEKQKLEHSRILLLKWMFSFLKENKIKFIIYITLLVISTVIMSIIPMISANIIDFGIISKNYTYLLNEIILYIILLTIYGISAINGQYGMGKVSQKMIFNIRNEIFSKLQKTSMDYFDKRPSGDIISIATNDVDQLNQLISGQFVMIINSVITIILTLVFMFMLNALLAALSLIIIPVIFFLMWLFMKMAVGAFKDTRKTISQVTTSIQENIAGVKVIQAYGQEQKATSEFDNANKANYDASFRVRKIFSSFFPLIGLITNIFTVFILFIGGYMALKSISVFGIYVSVGVLMAFITYLAQFFRPFMMLMQIQQMLESAFAASDRIYLLLKEKVEIPDPEIPFSPDKISRGKIEFIDVSFGYRINEKSVPDLSNEAEVISSNDMPPFKRPFKMMNKNNQGKITPSPVIIKNMADRLEKMLKNQIKMGGSRSSRSMDSSGMMGRGQPFMPSPQFIAKRLATIEIPDEIYNNFSNIVKEAINEQKKLMAHKQSKGYVLKNINLTIPAGKTLAIVGETGAGKTTLIKLISRFYDINQGKILIDGIDIKNIKKEDLRKMIGLVPQDAFIFTGTIKENLLYAIDNPTEKDVEKMISVSKFLGLHNFVATLPDKYDTFLIENGSNISIGQRQLIAFARALITDPKILILDEATSSVDPYTETLIQDALNKARQGRTTIIIAHRLSTIKNADRIIVLDKKTNGIIEEGTHEDLLQINGKYARLLKMQHKEIYIED